MTLSIVFPARDEALKVGRDVRAAAEFIAGHFPSGEIIVVDDGSRDDTSAQARGVPVPASVHLTVIRNEVSRGKGYSVRKGVLASTGHYVMFADAGLTVPFENASRGLRMLQQGECELAHGSRKLPESLILKDQDWDRKLVSRMFRWISHLLIDLPSHLTDTQCGFKVYNGETARAIYQESVIDGFMFDIEIVVRAAKRGAKIGEFPVEWRCDRDSRLSITKSPWHIIRDLLRIRRLSRRSYR